MKKISKWVTMCLKYICRLGREKKKKDKFFKIKRIKKIVCVVTHTFNMNNWEAEAVRSL